MAKALLTLPNPAAPGGRKTGIGAPAPDRLLDALFGAQTLGRRRFLQAARPLLRLLYLACARVLLVADMLIDVHVVLAGARLGVILAHSVQHKLAEFIRVGEPEPDGARHRGLQRLDRVDKAADARTMGIVPYLSAIIWLSPHGSNMLGTTTRSASA